jgi:alginate O-acetyltransferase complex protein AlgI
MAQHLAIFVNLVFYGWGEPVYILLMVFSIAVNYISGFLWKDTGRPEKNAGRWLAGCVAVNLSLLVFFKYYDFFASNLGRLPFLSFVKPLGLSLPIGISFYTFQTMSYPIDVYRNDAKVQRNFINFGTFVALFPQLIAGPIVRYKDIAEQLEGRRESTAQFASGICRFAAGLAKKVLLANSIGALWDVFKAAEPSGLSAASAWLGAIAFSFQIYFDFSATRTWP